jgi:PAS domain S-box-containing protein
MPPKKGTKGKKGPRKSGKRTIPGKERFQVLIESMSDVLVEVDGEGKFSYISQQLKERFGYEPKELIGKSAFEQVHPDDLERTLETVARAIEGDRIFDYEFRILHKNGHYVPANSSGRVVEEDGDIRIVGVVRNLSAAKEVEKALQEKNEFLDAIFNSTTEGIFVLDENLRYEYINPACGRIMGYEPEECIGKKAGSSKQRHPDHAGESVKALNKALKGEKANCNIRVKGKDGRYRVLDITYSAISWGSQNHILGIVNDVTESKSTLDELKASESRYRAVAEAAQDYIYMIDKDYSLAYVNEAGARLFRSTPTKLIGKKLKEIFPMEVYKEQSKSIKKVLDTEEEAYVEREYPLHGKTIWLSARLAPVHDGEGNVARVLGMSRDITKRKEAEIALRESEEKFRLIMDSSPFAITLSDLTGRVIESNQRAVELFGFKNKGETVGLSSFDFIAEKDQPEAIKNVERTLKTGTTRNIEYTLVRRDGSEFQGELATSLIRNADGKPTNFVAITQDVTERRFIDKVLKESEEKYSAVVENSKDPIVIIQDGKIKFVNSSTVEFTGYRLEELDNMNFLDLLEPSFRETELKRYKDRMAGKKVPEMYEIDIIRKDGSAFSVELNNTLINYEGRPATLSLVRDVTERKAMEQKWRSIAENSPDIVIMLDLKDRITFINRTVTPIKSEDVIGMSQYDWIEPKYHNIVKDITQKVVKTKKTGSYSIQGTGPKGTISWYETHVGPLMDGNRVYGIILFVNDITDRKKAEEALKESEEKYRSLFETSPDSITVIDMEGIIVETNDATTRVTGIPQKDLVGHPFTVLHTLFEDDIEKFQRLFEQLLNDEPFDNLELKVIQEGNVHWLESFPTLLKREGEIYAIQVITRDITERKRAEMEMRKQLLKFDVEEGNVYIVKERAPEQSVEIFNELLDVGYLGNVVSRTPIKHYRTHIKKSFDYTWISVKGSQDSVLPDVKIVEEHIEMLPTRQVILFEGVNYLVSKAGFKKTLSLIQAMTEIAYLKDHIIILSLDPSTVDEKEMRRIEKETSAVTTQMALGKMPEKLLEILKFINKENLTGINPSFSNVEVEHELSKPTVRKRIKELETRGCIKVIEKGRSKYLTITEKGKTYMVL